MCTLDATLSFAIVLMSLALPPSSKAAETKVFNVRDHGAAGDGTTLDTAALTKAVDACAAAGGGRVLLPAGKYLSGTIRLKSGVELHLDAGATLIGSPELKHYQNYQPPAAMMPETQWHAWHRALVLADGAKRIAVTGPGTIDGNQVFDPRGEERMRGPHTILLGNCSDVVIRDLSIRDSANYAVYFALTDRVEIRNTRITGGWDGVHFRGYRGHPCRDVTIADCQMLTGDDSIAGRYWENVRISNCQLNSSCNCVRLIGPATHLTIEKCRLYGPGEHPHRTSSRRETLAALNLQPGAWDATQGRLDDVTIRDIAIQNVAAPFHFSLKQGNTAGRIRVSRVQATGVYYTASSVESWAETPFEDVAFHDVCIEFSPKGKRGKPDQPVWIPGTDPRPLPVWGFYLRNVKHLTLDQVRLSCAKADARPVLLADGVEWLTLRDFAYPRKADAAEPLQLKDVKRVEQCGAARP